MYRKKALACQRATVFLDILRLFTCYANHSFPFCVDLRPGKTRYRGWESFGGSSENIHYSSLKQINTKNVQKLKVAWTFESGDVYPGSDIQCNPIVVGGVMYATTPKLQAGCD